MDRETRDRLLAQTQPSLAGKLNPPIRVMRPDAILLDAMPRMSLRAGRARLHVKPAS
jgi:hypothetical protein